MVYVNITSTLMGACNFSLPRLSLIREHKVRHHQGCWLIPSSVVVLRHGVPAGLLLTVLERFLPHILRLIPLEGGGKPPVTVTNKLDGQQCKSNSGAANQHTFVGCHT